MSRAIAILVLLVSTVSTAVAQETPRIGAINLSYVARSSKVGKSGLAQIEDASRKKAAEIDIKTADLRRQQAALQKTSVSLSARAIADLQRAFDKSRLELERFQQDARDEIAALQTSFDLDFRAKLAPVIEAVSKEKGLHFVFGLEEAAIVWWSPAVDISDEVVKRLDVEKK